MIEPTYFAPNVDLSSNYYRNSASGKSKYPIFSLLGPTLMKLGIIEEMYITYALLNNTSSSFHICKPDEIK